MYSIRRATNEDIEQINDIIHRAFKLYADELDKNTPVKALTESKDAVLNDIKNNNVYVAQDDASGKILGSIRYAVLTNELCYIYRFGVDPNISSTGIGSTLLQTVIDQCSTDGYRAITLHTNSKYYKLARYYYGKQFFVHSTSTAKGYIRALFVKELTKLPYDISPAFNQ